jgi:hypothetical protein
MFVYGELEGTKQEDVLGSDEALKEVKLPEYKLQV